MKEREFNRLIKQCTVNGRLDTAKVLALPESDRTAAAHYIVRSRGPLLVEFITRAIDDSWLDAMGYLHRTTGKSGYTFRHTTEHTIR